MITITLPWPHSQLSPNARTHWAKKAELKAQERQAAQIETRNQVADLEGVRRALDFGQFDGVRMEITFCAPDNRQRDIDNMLASCKAHLDGVADALGVNDKNFEPITLRRGKVVKGGQVIVRIGE